MSRNWLSCARILAFLGAIVGRALSADVELLEFEDELSDTEFDCHWSLWTDKACTVSKSGCRASISRQCVCLKFAEKPRHRVADYKTRTCNFGTFQNAEDKPDGRCDSNCQLLDAFFRRLDGLDGAWCPWSEWQSDTCRAGSEGLQEGFRHSYRQCLCPPLWLEGHQCRGSDSRYGNSRESLSEVSSVFQNLLIGAFPNAILGLLLPSVLVAWFCCLASPLRQGIQYGRLQSAAVVAELRALGSNVNRKRTSALCPMDQRPPAAVKVKVAAVPTVAAVPNVAAATNVAAGPTGAADPKVAAIADKAAVGDDDAMEADASVANEELESDEESIAYYASVANDEVESDEESIAYYASVANDEVDSNEGSIGDNASVANDEVDLNEESIADYASDSDEDSVADKTALAKGASEKK